MLHGHGSAGGAGHGMSTHGSWDTRSLPHSIAEKELIPIILACAAWGNAWHGRQVICQCDNQVIVACLPSRTSRDKGMHLLRCLVFVETIHYCYLHPIYVTVHDKTNHYYAGH